MVSKSIIESCIKKQENGFQSLYEQTISYAYATIKRYITNNEVCKDVVQESYITLFRKLHQFDPNKGTFNVWFRKIVVNCCLMQIRKENKLNLLIPLQEVGDIALSADSSFFNLSKSEIETFLVDMPLGYKTVFLMIVIDEYSHKEVAEILGISKEASRSQLSRAKKWLLTRFENSKKSNLYGIF